MKRITLLAVALLTVTLQTMARGGFAIVIDPESYEQARTEVAAYAAAIESVDGLKVHTVVDRWGVPDSIRAALMRLHADKKIGLEGVVLVGDIPIAMIRDAQHLTSAFKMKQSMDRKRSSVPSDRYYDDFGLDFTYQGRDDDAPYFYYSLTAKSEQRLEPDLYSGRIRPTDAGGTSRYEKLRAYLRKVVAEKQARPQLRRMFFFSGHGYISESKVARMDEKSGWYMHFPWLKGREDAISYMDHSDTNPVKEHLMNELMRPDLDFAILHHHGYWNTQYLDNIPKSIFRLIAGHTSVQPANVARTPTASACCWKSGSTCPPLGWTTPLIRPWCAATHWPTPCSTCIWKTSRSTAIHPTAGW